MGCRTYISINRNEDEVDTGIFGCLGKLVAYTEPSELENLKMWCDREITDEDDRKYLKKFFDIGYCCEAVTFNQSFDKYQLLTFLRAFFLDMEKFKEVENLHYSYIFEAMAILALSKDDDTYKIEWTEGG